MRCECCGVMMADTGNNLCDPCAAEWESGLSDEELQEREDERCVECRCGAYVWKNGHFVQVTDCVC